jgi:hypothetical protein
MTDTNMLLTAAGLVVTVLSLVVGIVSWRLGKLTTDQLSGTNTLIAKSHEDTRLLIRDVHRETLKFLRGEEGR